MLQVAEWMTNETTIATYFWRVQGTGLHFHSAQLIGAGFHDRINENLYWLLDRIALDRNVVWIHTFDEIVSSSTVWLQQFRKGKSFLV